MLESGKKKDNTIPLEVTPMIEEFSDAFPEDMPNLSHYRMNPIEHTELKR